MRGWAGLIGLLVAAALANDVRAAQPPAQGCRHPLALAHSAADLPPTVTASLRPWMALHGEAWNNGDALEPHDLTASYAWAARSGKAWIVAYAAGGRICCRTRFALFTAGGQAYRQVVPPVGRPDYFGDVSCAGIDPALDAYARGK
jgi:hypothetical protein